MRGLLGSELGTWPVGAVMFLREYLPIMKVIPLGDKIVVRRIEPEGVSPGGIVLPDSAIEAPRQGRVLSTGDGQMLPDGSRATHQVAEGDRVLFSSYAGTEVEVDGQQLLIMREEEVLAIVP